MVVTYALFALGVWELGRSQKNKMWLRWRSYARVREFHAKRKLSSCFTKNNRWDGEAQRRSWKVEAALLFVSVVFSVFVVWNLFSRRNFTQRAQRIQRTQKGICNWEL